MEKKFKEWSKNDLAISFCPKCKTKVEKASGCNHMTCYLCNFQWCWICGATYYDGHYNPLNPLGCGNQQFGEKRVWYKQMLINLGWLIFAIIALPLLVIFLLPAFFVSLTCS